MEGEQKVPMFRYVCKHEQESLCLCARACVSIPLFPVCRLSTSGQHTSQKCYPVSALTGDSALMSRRPRQSSTELEFVFQAEGYNPDTGV